MPQQNPIHVVLDMIEQRANEMMSVDQFAAAAYLSGSHLQLLFRHLTGQPLMAYARGRKLAHSLNELFNTNMRIVDIANEYGFVHEQSYARAFYAEFGCAPGKARREKIALTIRERISPDSLTTLRSGIMIGPEHAVIPRFYIVGIPTLFQDFDDRRDRFLPNAVAKSAYFHQLLPVKSTDPGVYYGLCHIVSKKDIEYMPSVRVSDLQHVPAGMKGWTVPSCQCVRFRYVGSHPPEEITMETAWETYQAVDRFFASQSRYQFSGSYHYERIDPTKFDGVYCQMDLMYPVLDRQEAKK